MISEIILKHRDGLDEESPETERLARFILEEMGLPSDEPEQDIVDLVNVLLQSTVFVAHDETGRMVSTASLLRTHEEMGSVINVVTREDARGQGIGAAVMKDLEIFAATDGIKILQVSPQNERADKFYQKLEYIEAPNTDPPTRFKLLV